MRQFRFSKTKMMLGLQCEKALYLSTHKPELGEEVSGAQQMLFDQGHEVGIEAQKRFPNGVLITASHEDSQLALDQTKKAISTGALAIYEATFAHEAILVKVDILSREKVGAPWELIEVKASTSAKEVHTQDAAIQLWALRGSGLDVKNVSILHINNECVFPDLTNLFNRVDVTKETEALQETIPSTLSRFQKVLGESTAPNLDIGPHCNDPYECVFKKHCWAAIPKISIFDIPSFRKKWELYSKGSVELSKLDLGEFNPIQRRMIECSVSKKQFIDGKGIKTEIAKWKYPISFLDFETIGFAIPRFDGMRPYEQLPFQFSCHVLRKPNLAPEHAEYLHSDESDPRKDLAKALADLVPEFGSVVAYNMGFEKRILLTLSEQFPKWRKVLTGIADRLVDPLPVFRAFVYDPAFRGSYSIKSVAPAILGEAASYEGMNVSNGMEAQASFLELIRNETSEKRREEIKRGLLDYCKKDTDEMMKLVLWLQEQTAELGGSTKRRGGKT